MKFDSLKHLGPIGLAASLALGTQVARADSAGVLVSLKISKNGETVAAPRMWTALEQAASLQLDQTLKISVTPSDREGKADMRFQIFTPGATGLELLAQPRMVARYTEEASLEFTTAAGERYRVAVVATKQDRPEQATLR